MTERVLLPDDAIPSHYELVITTNFTQLTFHTDLKINISINKPINQISLHSRDITIHSANLGDQQAIGIDYDLKYHIVTLKFENVVEIGESVLVISYTGILNGDMAGYYKSQYTDADGNKKIIGSTQFEALDARRAFPCWDEPARKATFQVIHIIPNNLTALSNMPETEVLHLPGGLKRVTFGVSPIMSTYLLAWAVGEFDFLTATTKGGVVLRVITPPGRAKQGQFALDVGVKALDFYDDFFQIPYPLPKLDMLCVTEFAMGAMENWGLVTYRENALMIDEIKASNVSKQRVATVITHELAHQWFGNLVTMSWWDALWLNEGFASFMEDFAVDSIFPSYRIWDQWTIDSYGAAQRLDSLRSSHPIIVPIKHAEEVEQVFDAISYSKGSTVVNMVYQTLGYDNFRKGLQIYFQRHAYGNTETPQLWDAWTEASGINVSELMNTWTTRMGYPFLSIVSEKWSEDSVELTLRQTWFLADGSYDEQVDGGQSNWQIPLFFTSSAGTTDKPVIMTEREQTFSFPVRGSSDYVKINAGQKALARVLYTPALLSKLSTAVSHGLLTPVDTASLLLDSYALVKANLASINDVVELLKAIPSVSVDGTVSYIVWAAIQGVLGGLALFLDQIGGEASSSFRAFAKNKIVQALDIVGWDPKPSDGHTDSLCRATLINLLDTFAYDDESVVNEARERFEKHFTDPSALPADYKTTVYKIILINGGEAEYNRILATYYATEDNQERKYALGSLGAAPDLKLKIRALDWAVKSGDVKLQDFYVKDKLAKASPSLFSAIIGLAISRFVTNEQASEIESFFSLNPVPQSSRRVSQSLELIRANAKLFDFVRSSKLVSDPINVWK
eukprot:gene20946-27148_t